MRIARNRHQEGTNCSIHLKPGFARLNASTVNPFITKGRYQERQAKLHALLSKWTYHSNRPVCLKKKSHVFSLVLPESVALSSAAVGESILEWNIQCPICFNLRKQTTIITEFYPQRQKSSLSTSQQHPILFLHLLSSSSIVKSQRQVFLHKKQGCLKEESIV